MDSNVLTLDRISELLSTTKQRGVYFGDIQAHVNSGELACNFSSLPYYKDKDAAAVRNSINGNIDKHTKANNWPNLTVVFDKTDKDNVQVILVNMDALATMQAEQNDDEE